MPKFSIIVPVYNAEKYLKEALDSVVHQIFTKFEVIVINDASTDSSLSIIRDYQARDSRIKLIDLKQNRGSGYGRNIALTKAKGKYVLFLDADDFLMRSALELANNAIRRKSKIDVLVWGFTMCNKRGIQKKEFLPSKPIKKKGETPFKLGLLRRKGFFAFPWIYVIRRKFINKHQLSFTEGIFFQDIQFTMQSLYFAKSVRVIPTPCVNYRKHGSSVTGHSTKQKIYDKFFAHENIKNFLMEQQTFPYYKSIYEAGFLTFCMLNCFKDFFSLSKDQVDSDLKKFVINKLKSDALNIETIQIVRDIGLSLSKDEFHSRVTFISASNGLLSLTKKYRWYAFKTRLIQKLYKAIKGFN